MLGTGGFRVPGTSVSSHLPIINGLVKLKLPKGVNMCGHGALHYGLASISVLFLY